VVDPDQPKPAIRAMCYGPTGMEEFKEIGIDQLREKLAKWPVVWIDVDGLGDAEVIKALGGLTGLHTLSLEDVAHLHQRPKIEDFGSYLFLVCRMPYRGQCLETEQVSLCLGKNFVMTFQEQNRPGDVFEPVRVRIRGPKSRVWDHGPDYLAYALVDAIVDSYFPVLEAYGEEVDRLEDETIDRPKPESVKRIHQVKRELIAARRAVWPMREMLNAALREHSPLITAETRVFLRDTYDHTVQIIDLVETYRDLTSGLMDLYLSVVSNRLNEIMKVLTVISTVFIPLTFIVGVYGMNFDTSSPWNMPELKSRYGYPVVMGLMLVIATGMLWAFRRRGWLGEVRKRGKRNNDGQDASNP
jgi:magnesium transporter